MAYQSLYRKYRPQTFSDVMGQGHVTRTLQNALASGRVGHGYLFTGTRGTAKTTVARLLAKALNCLSSDKPTPEPCNKCSACVSITSGSCIDVIEMDAASHRGVADIEEVRKAVGYGPMEMRYKVFIIDEAHQLSSDAKDAFLKTLEEPPDNVVFILATTEPQAIPITIRSRCQQFDFKRGTLHDIAARLRYVLDCEGVTYTPDAINLVARGAEGSWRDALSLLEQVLAFAPNHIGGTDVDAVLGTLDSEMLGRVTQAIAHKDAPGAFALAGELLDAGKEARTLLRTLSAHFRDLLLVSVGGPAVGMELTPEEVGRLQTEARPFSPPQMMRAMDILNEAQGETRWNNQHRLLVELAFLKLMTLHDGPPLAKGATTQPMPQTVFATAPIVFAPQPSVIVAPPTPVAQYPVTPPPSPPRSGEGSLVNERGVSIERFAGSGGSSEVSELPSPLRGGEGGGVIEPDTVALPPAFFASDDETDDEDDYAPPHTGDDAEPVYGALTGGEDTDEVTEPVYATQPSEPTVPIVADAPLLLLSDNEEDEAEAEAEPIDDGPSLFDEEFPNPTPAFVTPLPTALPVAAVAPAAVTDAPTPIFADTDEEEEVPPPAVLAVAEPVEPEGPVVTLDDVMRAWPDFLRKAGMVSKKTEMMMVTARPVSSDRSGIEIAFGSRATFDMMNTPVAQGFVRNVLLRSLSVSHVAVRFILDESASPAPPKRNTSKEKKTVRDPLAELDALEKGGDNNGFGSNGGGNAWNSGSNNSGPSYHAAPSPVYGFAGGNGNESVNRPAPFVPPPRRESEPFAPPSASFGVAQNAPRRASSGDDFASASAYGSPSVGLTGVVGGKTAVATATAAEHHAVLMENALVQDVLSIFGGEITDD